MQKVLGLDVGEKRIGVSVSDLLGMLAQPVKTILRKSNKEACEEIADILQRENIRKIIVGLPKNMDGSEGVQAENTKKFIEILKEYVQHVDIVYWDERLTSKMAKQSLSHMKVKRAKEKRLIDMVAAVHILQSYLDANKLSGK